MEEKCNKNRQTGDRRIKFTSILYKAASSQVKGNLFHQIIHYAFISEYFDELKRIVNVAIVEVYSMSSIYKCHAEKKKDRTEQSNKMEKSHINLGFFNTRQKKKKNIFCAGRR